MLPPPAKPAKWAAMGAGTERCPLSLLGYRVPACMLLIATSPTYHRCAARPLSVFFKRVVMGDLEHARSKALAQPMKLARDVRSYEVEASFLRSAAARRLATSGVRLSCALHVELRPSRQSPIESKFAMVLEDFSPADGWTQLGLLGLREERAALSTLARLHAYFWHGSAFWRESSTTERSELIAAVWPAGGYWQPSMQPAAQFEQLAEQYDAIRPKLGAQFESACAARSIDVSTLGSRLQQYAKGAAAASHPFDEVAQRWLASTEQQSLERYRTLIHGDPKGANLFFRDGAAGLDGERDVGVIDLQWCGFGLAATDVVHHLCASASPECLEGEGERALLDFYYVQLTDALAEFGVASSAEHAATEVITRDEFDAQVEDALLDMGRLVMAYQWSRANFGKAVLNRNAYNKDLRSAVWLAARVDALLKGREHS